MFEALVQERLRLALRNATRMEAFNIDNQTARASGRLVYANLIRDAA